MLYGFKNYGLVKAILVELSWKYKQTIGKVPGEPSPCPEKGNIAIRLIMRIAVYNGNAIYAETISLYLCALFVAWMFCSLGINLVLLIVFLAIMLAGITMYAVSLGRRITLDSNGVEISFLWIRKKYSWNEVRVRELFNNKNMLGYRIPYTSGMALSYKKLSRPKWMHPMQYCMLFHPFSYVVFHFPIKEQISDLYLKACYEVDQETLLQSLDVWGQGDGLREP